jgi:hypothetical protein
MHMMIKREEDDQLRKDSNGSKEQHKISSNPSSLSSPPSKTMIDETLTPVSTSSSALRIETQKVMIGGVTYEVDLAFASEPPAVVDQAEVEEAHQDQQRQNENREDLEDENDGNLFYTLFRLGFIVAILAQNSSITRLAILSIIAILIALGHLGLFRSNFFKRFWNPAPREAPVAAPPPPPSAEENDQDQQLLATEPTLVIERKGLWETCSHVFMTFLTSAFPLAPQQPHDGVAVDVHQRLA